MKLQVILFSEYCPYYLYGFGFLMLVLRDHEIFYKHFVLIFLCT